MKYFILVALIASLGSIICGYVLDVDYTQKLIGFGVLGLFVVVFPLFAYHRWKGKNIKDYMLTQENLEKMRENQKN
ncbi:hypothetical protein [Psychroserpens sp. SPM9]|uniref:hypothetical protein n=1 Tax=Psychroserpens sp. SPM9 TaxID=2975598 RepID=UPI0021A304CF|nr:hypothetical protein [Psychroserpens sp. SPM9]MDG5490803.1 hypothetical protein [Psychroserpens sp. SPM9]